VPGALAAAEGGYRLPQEAAALPFPRTAGWRAFCGRGRGYSGSGFISDAYLSSTVCPHEALVVRVRVRR